MNLASKPSRGRLIGYWIATVLVAFAMGSGGVADVLRIQPVVEGMTALGYPVYFCIILGVWKVLGAIAILIPGTPRLKEWAYAGIMFDLTGAAASHLFVGQPVGEAIAPVILTAIMFASWALRPPCRMLAGPCCSVERQPVPVST
ncbi:MAG TPA: DoxX family protein [Planctomycetaceae bacterium]|nr:DoxX family protein [Planctomycetaceae bacterium]